MTIEIKTSGLQTTAVGQKVRFQLFYEYRTMSNPPPVDWKAFDIQGNELRYLPDSVATTIGRDNLAVSLEGDVSRIEFLARGGDPNLLTICFSP